MDWRTQEANVGRLRQRIFTATREQDWSKVRNLQKLMLRSRSNTLVSVRQVTQRNAGRKTAGIEGEVALTSEARAEIAVQVHANIRSWSPRAVKRVYIPKSSDRAKLRPLGIPTVADRVAQTVARMYLEPAVESIFRPDSYGYRPKNSALDAVGVCRRRCWKADWVIDLDIRAFFDSVPWDLILKAVEHHTDQRWILLYVRRWLAAPIQRPDGGLVARDRGTPQGSAISPLLANLFIHYAFDTWMAREFPSISFERYCDDAVVHCGSKRQARMVRDAIATRLAHVGLELHLEKTRIVYCKDADRRGDHEVTSFTFLGYTFRPRLAKNKWGKHFVNFLPAVSRDAVVSMGREIRSWHIARRSDKSLNDLARMFNSIVQGGSTTLGASTSPCCIPS